MSQPTSRRLGYSVTAVVSWKRSKETAGKTVNVVVVLLCNTVDDVRHRILKCIKSLRFILCSKKVCLSETIIHTASRLNILLFCILLSNCISTIIYDTYFKKSRFSLAIHSFFIWRIQASGLSRYSFFFSEISAAALKFINNTAFDPPQSANAQTAPRYQAWYRTCII